MGRSSGFNFGGSYSSHHPQQHRASSMNGTGVSYLTSGNSDLHFHGPEVRDSLCLLLPKLFVT